MKMKVVILGAGPSGLGAAYRLSRGRVETEVIEKDSIVGGLSSTYKIKNYLIEKFYHIVYTTDSIFLEMIKELGLYKKLKWRESKVGFFYDGKIYKMSTPFDLLRFRPLKFLDRIKFGIMTLKSSYFQDMNKLKMMNAEEWLKKEWGRDIYEKIFKHLLRTKFGMSMDKASAAFVCGRIKARAESRSGGKEKLGYLEGSFQKVFEEMKRAAKTTIFHLNSEVESVEKKGEKFIIKFKKEGREKEIKGDFVINTLPLNLDLIKGWPLDYEKKLKKIQYQAVICILMGLKKRLSDYYWINILSDKIPFGVMVEHTNLESEKNYDGDHLIYLGKYLDKKEELWKKNDKEIIRIFLQALKNMFPKLKEEDILWCKVSRDAFSTPLFTIDFSQIMPEIESPLKGLYFAGNIRIYPNSRNMNEVIKSAYEATDKILKNHSLKINRYPIKPGNKAVRTNHIIEKEKPSSAVEPSKVKQ